MRLGKRTEIMFPLKHLMILVFWASNITVELTSDQLWNWQYMIDVLALHSLQPETIYGLHFSIKKISLLFIANYQQIEWKPWTSMTNCDWWHLNSFFDIIWIKCVAAWNIMTVKNNKFESRIRLVCLMNKLSCL